MNARNSQRNASSHLAGELLKLKDEFTKFHAMNSFVLNAIGLMLTEDAWTDPAISNGALLCVDHIHAKSNEIKAAIDNLHTAVKTTRR